MVKNFKIWTEKIAKWILKFVFDCICPIGVIKPLLDETKILFDALSAISKVLFILVTILCLTGYTYILLLTIKPLLLKLNLSGIIENIADGSWKHLFYLYAVHVGGIIIGYSIDPSKRKHWKSCIITCINLGTFFIFLTIVRYCYIPLIQSLYLFRLEILPILLFECFIASCIFYTIKYFFGEQINKIMNSNKSNAENLQGIVDTIIKDINNKIPNIQKLENTINNLSEEMDKALKLNDDMQFKLLPYYRNYNHLFNYEKQQIVARNCILKHFLVRRPNNTNYLSNINLRIIEDIMSNSHQVEIYYCQNIYKIAEENNSEFNRNIRDQIEKYFLKGINRKKKHNNIAKIDFINVHIKNLTTKAIKQDGEFNKLVYQGQESKNRAQKQKVDDTGIFKNIEIHNHCELCKNFDIKQTQTTQPLHFLCLKVLDHKLENSTKKHIGYLFKVYISYTLEDGKPKADMIHNNIEKLHDEYDNIDNIKY